MIFTIFVMVFGVALYGTFVYILVLIIKALRKYLKASDVKKSAINKSLGEAIKEYRTT